MKRFYAVSLLLLHVGLTVLSAQNISNTEKRRMNLAVLETLERYEKLSEVHTVGQVDELVSLFRSPKTMVYNDLIGVSDMRSLPVKEYASLIHGMHNVDVTIRNVRKSQPYVSAGSLCVDVSFEKSVSYYDERNVWYSSDEVYGEPYIIDFVMSYDDFDGTCYIESVKGRLDSVEPLGVDHLILEGSSARQYEGLRYRNGDAAVKGKYYDLEDCRPVRFGEKGFAYLPSSAADEDWYYMQDIPGSLDPDEFIRTSVAKDGTLRLSSVKRHFRARIYNSTTLAGAFKVEGELDRKFSLSNETGVEIRYMFDLGNRFNIGIAAGVGAAYDYLDVAVKDYSYSYQFNQKPRKYDIGVLGQKYTMVDGVLSGGLALEFALSRRAVMNVDLGGKAYYNFMARQGDVYGDYTVSYADTTVHIRGHFKAENVANKMELKPDVWPCPLSVVAGLGFSVNMTKASLFSIGLKYEHGLNYYYQCEVRPYKEYKTPIKASYATGKDVAQYDFAESFCLKKRALWLDLGFVFKF